jgi:hypothetical protein
VRHTGDTIALDVRGHGKVSISGDPPKKFVLNGELSPRYTRDVARSQLDIDVPDPGPLALSEPVLSTDATEVYKALVGFRPGPALPPWNPVVISWTTSLPADATIEYAPVGTDDWIRNIKPDPVAKHRMAINRLTPGTSYRLRIKSMADDGRTGSTELTYECPAQQP